MQIAHLTITTYSGTIADASHWMGRIRFQGDKDDVNVECAVTPEVAKSLNRDARRKGDVYRYTVGGTTSRFDDRETLIKHSIELAQSRCPDVVLFEGHHGILDPQPVLVGPEDFKTAANMLVHEAEANDWWEGNDDAMEDIYGRWKELFVEYGIKR